jgi:hypothetical protein
MWVEHVILITFFLVNDNKWSNSNDM